ncbi:TIGR03668 family PPOX class F420-dependent oxidoreductase [Kitasatospora atroaurantiaca]|uniref:TIGR03668 family PPOX class F420-dependent oxidoreductase n=1 Tax=Kitasatospora atroaurantiaca TaxID=285545 RepID=UPI003CCC4E13
MPDMAVEEARRRFALARVARLATVGSDGRPHLVPVTFAGSFTEAGDTVVTAVDHKPKRSPQLKRLRNIAAHPAVCLLVDEYDEQWERLWWVRADGDARVVPPPVAGGPAASPDHHEAIELLRRKYPQYGPRPPEGSVVLITVRAWRGWSALPGP